MMICSCMLEKNILKENLLSYFRIIDILVKIKDEPIFRVDCQKKSLKEIIDDCHGPTHDLKGYLGLTDSVLDIMQNETVEVGKIIAQT